MERRLVRIISKICCLFESSDLLTFNPYDNAVCAKNITYFQGFEKISTQQLVLEF